MNQIKSWLTVKEAAFVVGKTPKAVYAWIDQKKVDTRVNEHGVTEVGHLSLMRCEATTRRGRPKASAEKNG